MIYKEISIRHIKTNMATYYHVDDIINYIKAVALNEEDVNVHNRLFEAAENLKFPKETT